MAQGLMTLVPRIHRSAPGWVASHRVKMCLSRSTTQDLLFAAPLGVSREIHLEMLRVALHTICTMMYKTKKQNSNNKKTKSGAAG